MISKEQAIEYLQGFLDTNAYTEVIKSAFNMAIKALEKQIDDEWVSVKDRKPEYDSNCLITTENGEILTSKFYGYGEECQGFKEFPEGVWEINAYGEEVIAWMPSPERFKEII